MADDDALSEGSLRRYRRSRSPSFRPTSSVRPPLQRRGSIRATVARVAGQLRDQGARPERALEKPVDRLVERRSPGEVRSVTLGALEQLKAKVGQGPRPVAKASSLSQVFQKIGKAKPDAKSRRLAETAGVSMCLGLERGGELCTWE